MESFTETENVSWFTRIKNAFAGILFGGILFLVAFPLLFWNEGRSVKTARMLSEGRGAVVAVQADQVDSANDGALVHLTGEATTDEVLADPDFGISTTALQLEREVQMYQWDQDSETKKEKKLGGGETRTTVYTYQKLWSDDPIDSSKFKERAGHENPTHWAYRSKEWTTDSAKLGAYTLSESQVNQIGGAKSLSIAGMDGLKVGGRAINPNAVSGSNTGNATANSNTGNSSTNGATGNNTVTNNTTSGETTTTTTTSGVTITTTNNRMATGNAPRLEGNTVYVGTGSLSAPQVGDLRIEWQVVEPKTISVIAQQNGDSLRAYETEAGGDIEMVEAGDRSADQMFSQAESRNTMTAWLIRLGGFVAMFLGVSLVLRPLVVLADVVPILGSLAGFGVAIVAFAVAAPLSLITIAIGWIAYRPVLGISLLVLALIAGGAGFWLWKGWSTTAAE